MGFGELWAFPINSALPTYLGWPCGMAQLEAKEAAVYFQQLFGEQIG